MGNITIVEGLIVKQFANGDIQTIIHRDTFAATLQELKPSTSGCIRLHVQKQTSPVKNYSHKKPTVKI